MECEPFLVAEAVRGVLAQRLVRRPCKYCRKAYTLTKSELQALGIAGLPTGTVFYKSVGCSECREIGYAGRIGIFELVTVDDEMQRMIIGRSNKDALLQHVLKTGMKTLREDGGKKVMRGLTTTAEVLRITEDITGIQYAEKLRAITSQEICEFKERE